MTENNSVKSLIGGEVKVLNDMVGSVTVSAWREQAERAAVRLCGETGKMMLRGTFPSIRAGEYYDKHLLIDTLMDLGPVPAAKQREQARRHCIPSNTLTLTSYPYPFPYPHPTPTATPTSYGLLPTSDYLLPTSYSYSDS